MSSKVIKKLSLILIMFIAFFGFTNVLSAATVRTRAFYPKPYNNVYFSLRLYNKGSTGTPSLNTGIYTVNGMHAYCLEPGVAINGTSGYYTTSNVPLSNYTSGYFTTNSNSWQFVANDNNGTKNDRRVLISYILTFAQNEGDIASSNYNSSNWSNIAKTKVSEYQTSKLSNTYKIFAAQGMIWEVVVGERKSFNHIWPEYGPACSFYNVINGKNNCNKANTTAIKNEYDRIAIAIQNSFYKLNPGESSGNKKFKPGNALANVVPLSWNSAKKKYTLTIYDANFKYWRVDDAATSDDLEVEMGSNYITISSSNPISQDAAKQVAIKIYNKNEKIKSTLNISDPTVYTDSSLQDIVVIGGTTNWSYIKVYTPKYQIKVNKKANLDGKSLSGAKFNVCTNSSCTKVLGTMTTGSDGTAVYKNIPSPGTYYVKEIEAPAGYELDSTPHVVTVSTTNIAGSTSYGSITVNDKNKEFNLTKMSVDENGNAMILDDGCGTDNYTGPEFEIKENGNSLYFKEISPGVYNYANKDTDGAVTKLKTCNGKMKVYTLPNCSYTITETKAPEGLTLPANPTRTINVCGSDKNVSFTNGFAGLEFQKKDEDGNFIAGGKFSLQKKENNVYKDVLLKEVEEGKYVYDDNLKETDEGATYIITTKDGEPEGEEKGIARITKLPPGEYRISEKEAPEGFELIEDKDSKALVTIKDSDKGDYYLVEMIDQKVNKNGSKASAELVVTITTGRNVPNYVLIISVLSVLLIIAIILRKRIKK